MNHYRISFVHMTVTDNLESVVDSCERVNPPVDGVHFYWSSNPFGKERGFPGVPEDLVKDVIEQILENEVSSISIVRKWRHKEMNG